MISYLAIWGKPQERHESDQQFETYEEANAYATKMKEQAYPGEDNAFAFAHSFEW